MKKISKIIVFILMLVVSVASFVISPVLGVVMAAGTGLVGASIVITKMPTKGSVNTPVYLPKGTSANGGEVTIKVTDPRGAAVTPTLETSGEYAGQYKFVPTMVGDYKVQYVAAASGTIKSTTSQIYTVRVTSSKATLSFETNTPFMLPSSIGTQTPIVLPYPNISETGKAEDEVAGNYEKVDVEIKDSNGDVVPEKTVTIEGQKYYVLAANKDAEQNYIYGTYSIAYSYVNSSGVRVTKTYTINVNQNYTTENQNVTFTWQGDLPETAVLGEEVELPTPVTVDKNSNNSSVLTYTKVLVNLMDDQTVVKSYDVDQDLKFTPMDQATNSKYYQVKYNIYTLEKLDLYNYFTANTTATLDDYLDDLEPTLTRTYEIKDVKDSIKPTATAVNAYTVENVENVKTPKDVDTTDIGYIVPSKARTNVAITLPAIYAEDYDSFDALKLTRGISYKSSATSTSDTTVWIETASNTTIKDSDDNDLITFTKVESNELSTVTFHQAGTYKIIYQAKDSSGNTNKDLVFKIVVSKDANYADAVAPHITLTGIQNSVLNGETVSFDAPVVIDYAEDHDANPTSTSTVDSNVKTDVYYYYGEYVEGKQPTDDGCTIIQKDQADSKKYSFAVNATNQTKLTIVVRAEDDAQYTKNGLGTAGADINNVSYAYKTINIYGIEDDSAEPVLYDSANALEALATRLTNSGNKYAQGEVVNIFGEEATSILKYSDVNDQSTNKTGNLVSSLVVYDANGNELEVTGFSYEYDGSYISLKGGKIVTTVKGTYQVVITTTDVAGNSLVNSVYFEVKDTNAPAQPDVKNLKTTMELGESYTLPTAIVMDDGQVIQNQSKMAVKFVGDNPLYEFEHESLKFTPKRAGTYSFVYVASDGVNTTESAVYTITVKDTTKPVIKLNEDTVIMPATAKVGTVVELPSFTAEDNNGIKSLSVKVTDSKGDVVDPMDGEEFKFTFEDDGKYKVVYTAVDLAGNTTTQEYTIAVGDVVAPVIELDAANKVINKTFKIGESLTLDIDGINVTDGDKEYDVEDEVNKSDGKVKIVVIGPDGTETQLKSSNNYSYEFKTAGTYTLKYVASDEAQNDSDPIAYTFEVEGNTNTSSISEQTWGTILIVGALALLAGVVIYFVRTKDKSEDKLEKAKEIANKNKKD